VQERRGGEDIARHSLIISVSAQAKGDQHANDTSWRIISGICGYSLAMCLAISCIEHSNVGQALTCDLLEA
jgi:hypothetical protein